MNYKILLTGIILTLTFFGYSTFAQAADLTITCNGVNCSSSGQSLFNQTNIAPGFSITKSILINNTANSDSCNLHLLVTRQGQAQDPDLAAKIITVIKDNSTVYFGDESNVNPKRFSDLFGQDVSLGIVNAGLTQEYSWSANFETSSGNEYQNSSTTFGFNLNFTCGTPPVINPTSTPTPTQQLQFQQITPLVLGEITDNTTPTPTEALTGNGDGAINNGNVLGTSCENIVYSWWIVLVIQIVLSSVILVIKNIKASLSGFWLLLIILAAISQLVHNYLGCGCSPGFWCSNYLLLNLIVTLFGLFVYYFLTHFKPVK